MHALVTGGAGFIGAHVARCGLAPAWARKVGARQSREFGAIEVAKGLLASWR